MMDKEKNASNIINTIPSEPMSSEAGFKAIGLASFFDAQDDAHLDWEDMFDVKCRDIDLTFPRYSVEMQPPAVQRPSGSNGRRPPPTDQ